MSPKLAAPTQILRCLEGTQTKPLRSYNLTGPPYMQQHQVYASNIAYHSIVASLDNARTAAQHALSGTAA
jgi:hypothetical protein